ncbi:hypothetical protein C2S51_021315 [Perilla frutescens var. frutescens]|nr:hypothetical protein C2S51_021315 [Perilla frutescens var. frutescens]
MSIVCTLCCWLKKIWILQQNAIRLQYLGLAQSTGEGGIKAAFLRFGEVSRVKVVLDKKTKQSLGFAYVWFLSEEHAQTAIEEMNGQFLEGRFIHVVLAKPGSCKARPKPSPYKF